MKNKQDSNKCYVFSQATLDLALQEWLESESKNNPKKAESFQITVAALPWFLIHLEQTTAIYMFTQDNLITEMEVWKSSQLSDYPQQKKRIEETCSQLIHFFQSGIVLEHKMLIEA